MSSSRTRRRGRGGPLLEPGRASAGSVMRSSPSGAAASRTRMSYRGRDQSAVAARRPVGGAEVCQTWGGGGMRDGRGGSAYGTGARQKCRAQRVFAGRDAVLVAQVTTRQKHAGQRGAGGSCRSGAARLGTPSQPGRHHLSCLVAKMILVTCKSDVPPGWHAPARSVIFARYGYPVASWADQAIWWHVYPLGFTGAE
jgi:hypothetical protein